MPGTTPESGLMKKCKWGVWSGANIMQWEKGQKSKGYNH